MLGCGEKGDGFHRTRSSPDGAPIIAAIRAAIDDAGLRPDQIDTVNAHGTGTPENVAQCEDSYTGKYLRGILK